MDPGSATCITRQHLTPIGNSSNIYRLKRKNRQLTVSITWNVVTVGPDTDQYVDRLNSLGYILERVSEPTLRLLPCYGVFDDTDYELKYREKRLGYVFVFHAREFQTV